MIETFSLTAVRHTANLIAPFVIETPSISWTGPELGSLMSPDTKIWAKLEPFQHSGTFKARGALSNMLRLNPAERQRGITAMSAGNHAVAVAYAASVCDVHAKVVMQSSANPARIEMVKQLGAELVMAEDGPSGFALARDIAAAERRTFIHPFDGIPTALGTATLGLEMHQQAGDLDALIIGIGGGGLAAGVAAVTRLLNPSCHIIGVEPEGADAMHRSFASGKPEDIGIPDTIADSLAPPMTLPVPFQLCRDNLTELVKVTDQELMDAMGLIFRDLKMAVEPACAASTAALLKRKDQLDGKKIGVVLCGSNIDWPSYSALVSTH